MAFGLVDTISVWMSCCTMPPARRDFFGLADEFDGHLDVDGHVDIDPEEVDVGDVAASRVALDLFDQRGLTAAVEIELDQRVDTGVGGERTPQLTPGHVNGSGVCPSP